VSLFDDPQVARQLRDIINRISSDMGNIGAHVDRIASRSTQAAREVREEAKSAAVETAELALALEDTVENQIKLRHAIEDAADAAKKLKEEYADALKTSIDRWRDFMDKMKVQKAEVGSARSFMDALMFGNDTEVNSFTGKAGGMLKSVQSLIGDAQSQIFKGMPAGGWMGALIMGLNANSDDDFLARQMTHKFRQLGTAGSNELAQLTGAVQRGTRGSNMHFVNNDALLTSQAQFIGAGYGMKDTEKEFTSSLFGLKETAAVTAAAFDKYFSLSNGTAAKAITEFALQTGSGVDATVRSMEDLARVSTVTGSNFGVLLGVFQQVTSQIRFQSFEVGALGGMYAKLSGIGKDFGLDKEGQNKLGQETMVGVAKGIQAMPDPMKAIIGQQIADDLRRQGLNLSDGSGLDDIYRMKNGFKGEGDLPEGFNLTTAIFEKMVSEVRGIVKGDSTDDFEARSRVLQSKYKLDVATADNVARLRTSSDGKLDLTTNPEDTARFLKAKDAVESAEKNPIQELLEKLNGILTMALQQVITYLGLIASTLVLFASSFGNIEKMRALPGLVAANYQLTVPGQENLNKQILAAPAAVKSAMTNIMGPMQHMAWSADGRSNSEAAIDAFTGMSGLMSGGSPTTGIATVIGRMVVEKVMDGLINSLGEVQLPAGSLMIKHIPANKLAGKSADAE